MIKQTCFLGQSMSFFLVPRIYPRALHTLAYNTPHLGIIFDQLVSVSTRCTLTVNTSIVKTLRMACSEETCLALLCSAFPKHVWKLRTAGTYCLWASSVDYIDWRKARWHMCLNNMRLSQCTWYLPMNHMINPRGYFVQRLSIGNKK